MSCRCYHSSQYLSFPIQAPQPCGPRENWPIYYVPSVTERGMGLYYCPSCQDGLWEARIAAGLSVNEDEPVSPPTFFQRAWNALRKSLPIRGNRYEPGSPQ